MQLTNTENRYGLVSIVFHWTMAFIVILMLCLGLYMTNLPVSLQKLKLYGWHKEWGLIILMLISMRFLWRLFSIIPSLSELPWWERKAAKVVHWAFYIVLFAMPVTGWLMSSFASLPVSFFGLFVMPDIVSPSEEKRMLFAEIHEWLTYILIAMIVLHVAAALKHYVIDKDDILQRMF